MWSAASKNAKQKMKTRAGELGVDWDAEVAALAGARDWGAALLDATDTAVTTPDYYRAGPCLRHLSGIL